jgi:hypothetical protein
VPGGIPYHLTGVIPITVDDLAVTSFLTISITTIDLYLSFRNRFFSDPML